MKAIYQGKEFDCSPQRGGKYALISSTFIHGFQLDYDVYVKIVDRSECDRVYVEEPRFCYKGCEYRYRDEKDGKILIELPYDEDDDEIIRLSYDEYGKWVPLSDGEKVIWTDER